MPETPEPSQRSALRQRLSCSKKTKPPPKKSPYDGFNYSPFDQEPIKPFPDSAPDPAPTIIDLRDQPVAEIVSESSSVRRQRLLNEARLSAERRERERARKRSCQAADNGSDSGALSALLQELNDAAHRPQKMRRKSEKLVAQLPEGGQELNGLLNELMEDHKGGEGKRDEREGEEVEECGRQLQSKEEKREEKERTEKNEEKKKEERERKRKKESAKKRGKGNGKEVSFLEEEKDGELACLLSELLRRNKEEEEKENEGPGPSTAEEKSGVLSASMCEMFEDSFEAADFVR